jgi:hypothetical protein
MALVGGLLIVAIGVFLFEMMTISGNPAIDSSQNVLYSLFVLPLGPGPQADTPKEVDSFLELLVAFTLPLGLAIYAWLIGSSPGLRRWLGFIIGLQVLLFYIDLGSFHLPVLSQFVTSQLFTVCAIILSTAKTIWFLSPQRRSR